VALFFTRIYNRLLRPGIAAMVSNLHTVPTTLKRAFDTLATQIETLIQDASFTPKNLTHSRQVSFVKQS
jgi:hypothetical protein